MDTSLDQLYLRRVLSSCVSADRRQTPDITVRHLEFKIKDLFLKYETQKGDYSNAGLHPKRSGTTTATVWEQFPQVEWKQDGFHWEDTVLSTGLGFQNTQDVFWSSFHLILSHNVNI